MELTRAIVAAGLCAAIGACGGCGGDGPTPRPGGESEVDTRPAAAALGPDEARYELELRHRPGALSGVERIEFRNPFARPLAGVWVRAWANAFGTCARPRIRVTALAGARIGARRHGCTALRFDLREPIGPGGSGELRLRFALTVPRTGDRFGRAGGLDYLGNALPILAVADDGRPRLPPYSFRGDSFFSLAADWRVELELAPGEQVASTGSETGRSGHTVTLEAQRERDFALVAGPMEVVERRAGETLVRWFRPRGTAAAPARRGLAIAVRSLTELERRLGPYGAAELDAVQAPGDIARGAGMAMEYPQLILSPPAPQAVTHEVAHQWFYRLVGNDQWREPWVDETLTEYSALRLGRALHGPDRLRGCVEHDREPNPPRALDSTMGELERTPGRAVRDTLYIEGVCALFNLTREAGAERVDEVLRELVRRHRHGVLTSAELGRALRALPGSEEALEPVGL